MIKEIRAKIGGGGSYLQSALDRARTRRGEFGVSQTAKEEDTENQATFGVGEHGNVGGRQGAESGILFDPNSWFYPPDLKETAAVEAAAGMWARSLSACSVSPALPAITPRFLANVAHRLFKKGECLFRILVDPETAAVRFASCPSWDIQGSEDEETWRYRCEISGPNTSRTALVPSGQCLHFRYYSEPGREWVGVSPLSRMEGTIDTARKISRNTGYAFNAGSGTLILRGSEEQLGVQDKFRSNVLSRALSIMSGGVTISHTGTDALNEGQQFPPQVHRLTPPISQETSLLSQGVGREIAAAAGIPPALVSQSAGNSMREAHRQFVLVTIKPLAYIVANELSRKLGLDISLDTGPLRSSDLSGISRSVKALVEAGVPLEKAMETAGITD